MTMTRHTQATTLPTVNHGATVLACSRTTPDRFWRKRWEAVNSAAYPLWPMAPQNCVGVDRVDGWGVRGGLLGHHCGTPLSSGPGARVGCIHGVGPSVLPTVESGRLRKQVGRQVFAGGLEQVCRFPSRYLLTCR